MFGSASSSRVPGAVVGPSERLIIAGSVLGEGNVRSKDNAMLTADQRELLRRHVSIDGGGNVVGNDNTVRVTKQAAGDYMCTA